MTDPGDRPPAAEEYVPADDAVIGRAFKWSLAVLVVVAVVVVGALWLLRDRAETPEVVERPGPVEAPERLVQDTSRMPTVRFTDITEAAGIDFVHTSGAVGEKLLPETMGSGCAVLDHDGDGDQDLLFVNGRPWPDAAGGDADPTAALYRNDGTGRFEDVTAEAGLDVAMHGTGVAAGDWDNDGDPDLYFTGLGPNRLFRNDDGRFVDVTAAAGVAGADDDWSTSAGFLDADNDGDLDLFVCNYVRWSAELDRRLNFTLNGTDRAYGPPLQYEGAHCRLYRNDGRRFTDVSADAGIEVTNPATDRPMAKALAAVFVDADRDGDLDIFVANDTVQNFVFRNRGDGTFEEVGAESGAAFDAMGSATGAMGIDAADYANDGAIGVGIGNFANESTSFYVQQGDPWQFADMASSEGIGSPSRLNLSFGLFFFDFDLDGRLDLLQANGHLEDEINEIQPSQHYLQPAQLFWNCGADARACFALVPADRAGDLTTPIVGRGAAYGDLDGDGDLDVVLTQTGRRPLVLRNDQDLGHHWLRVRLHGADVSSPRDAIGTTVELVAGGVTQRRSVMPTRSYLSQVELPVTFGLGDADAVDELRVRWPGGDEQIVEVDGVDRVIEIVQAVDDAAPPGSPGG
ncbi:MAG: CRTAC1 family protein [Planctomycetota bacterium]|jgi:hypothetical protein